MSTKEKASQISILHSGRDLFGPNHNSVDVVVVSAHLKPQCCGRLLETKFAISAQPRVIAVLAVTVLRCPMTTSRVARDCMAGGDSGQPPQGEGEGNV